MPVQSIMCLHNCKRYLFPFFYHQSISLVVKSWKSLFLIQTEREHDEICTIRLRCEKTRRRINCCFISISICRIKFQLWIGPSAWLLQYFLFSNACVKMRLFLTAKHNIFMQDFKSCKSTRLFQMSQVLYVSSARTKCFCPASFDLR